MPDKTQENNKKTNPAQGFLSGLAYGLKNIASALGGYVYASQKQFERDVPAENKDGGFMQTLKSWFYSSPDVNMAHMFGNGKQSADEAVHGMEKINDSIDKNVIPENVKKWQEGVPNSGFITQTANSIGNMTPALAVNTIPVVGSFASVSAFAAESIGESTLEAKNQGATNEDALKYGTTMGVIGGAAQFIPGGAITKRIFGKEIGKVTENIARPFVKKAVNVAINATSQGFQGVAIDAAEPIARKETFQPNAEYDYTIGKAASDFVHGAAVGTIIGGAREVGREGREEDNNTKEQNSPQESQETRTHL